MCRDQSIVDITRMRGRVANPVEAGQLGQPAYEFAETPISAIGTLPMIGVHVLAQESDLAHPGSDGVTRLGQDLYHRTRVLGAARVRYDAKAAKLVAPFLNREEGGHPCCR